MSFKSGAQQSGSHLPQVPVQDHKTKKRELTTSSTNLSLHTETRKATKDPPSLVITDPHTGEVSVIVEFGKDKVSVSVSEGNSWSFADKLRPQEAAKLIAERIEDKAPVGVIEEKSDIVCFFADSLKPQQIGKLVAGIAEGKMGLAELSQQQPR